MNTTELKGVRIDNLTQIYTALNDTTQNHPYLCRTYDQNIGQVRVLTQDLYNQAKQQDKFWNKTYSKMSLIEVASFVNQSVYKDLETSGVDLKNSFKNKEELVGLLKNCRDKTIKKIESMTGLSKIIYKIFYWFFDPINKINDLSGLSEKTCKNYHFSYHVALELLEFESDGTVNSQKNWTLKQLQTWLDKVEKRDKKSLNDQQTIVKCEDLSKRWEEALKN